MSDSFPHRREFCARNAVAAATCLGLGRNVLAANPAQPKAQIAITLDLEMSRNFPRREDLHWDYQKGNLDQAAKDYTTRACQLVKERGGIIHTFVVGQVFEQADVDWLQRIADDGHPIGNHTYDHVYVLAKDLNSLQYRFQRAPWLIEGRSPQDVIRQNIAITTKALQHRIGVEPTGFRTPGGFAKGLAGRPDIQRMLLDLGYEWVSSKYPKHDIEDIHTTGNPPANHIYESIVAAQASAQPFVYPTGLIEVPMSPISDIGAFRNGRWQLPHFLKAVELAMQWTLEHRATFDFLAHPSCLGIVDPQLQTIRLICDLVESAGDQAELVDLTTLAQRATTR